MHLLVDALSLNQAILCTVLYRNGELLVAYLKGEVCRKKRFINQEMVVMADEESRMGTLRSP